MRNCVPMVLTLHCILEPTSFRHTPLWQASNKIPAQSNFSFLQLCSHSLLCFPNALPIHRSWRTSQHWAGGLNACMYHEVLLLLKELLIFEEKQQAKLLKHIFNSQLWLHCNTRNWEKPAGDTAPTPKHSKKRSEKFGSIYCFEQCRGA